MARRPKLPAEELDLIRGLAARASELVRSGGGKFNQASIERKMESLVRSGARREEDAFDRWKAIYARSTRHGQLVGWSILEEGISHGSGRFTFPGLASEAPESRLRPTDPESSPGTYPGSSTKPWDQMSWEERLAKAGRLLWQDQITRRGVLRRLGIVGLTNFFDEVTAGTYDGEGYTPYEEMELLSQGWSFGLITRADGGSQRRLAQRVYVTLGLRPRPMIQLVFADGKSATARLGRLHAFRRWLTWYIPWLA